MKIFDDMLAGNAMQWCIRAKMNMQDKVKCLRDPVFYRCKKEPHHKTGTKYKAYPTYDMACPVVDSIEGVTHALRTIEYRDRNALYDWVQKHCEIRPVIIYDYSKLCLISTVLSKRKLRWFVESGHVEGWDDPRFPTVQGIMRRGMTVEALRNFMLEQGPSKNTNLQEWDKIWAINKDILDPISHRYTAIVEKTACKLFIENGPEHIEARSQDLHPKNADIGSKAVFYGKELLIEKDDAVKIIVGQKVTLMKWGNCTITKRTEEDGQISLWGTIDEADKDFKGTAKITWICNDPGTTMKIKIVEFDHLITEPKIEEDTNVADIVNKNSRIEYTAIAEGALRSLQKGCIFQFERRGFYFLDQVELHGKQMVVHFVPDGKTKSMSGIQHAVDASTTAKGKNAQEK